MCQVICWSLGRGQGTLNNRYKYLSCTHLWTVSQSGAKLNGQLYWTKNYLAYLCMPLVVSMSLPERIRTQGLWMWG